MRVKYPKVRGTATVKSFIQTATYLKVNSKQVSVAGLVCASLQQLDRFTRENGERINLWGTECFSLCQTNLLKVDLMATKS